MLQVIIMLIVVGLVKSLLCWRGVRGRDLCNEGEEGGKGGNTLRVCIYI